MFCGWEEGRMTSSLYRTQLKVYCTAVVQVIYWFLLINSSCTCTNDIDA